MQSALFTRAALGGVLVFSAAIVAKTVFIPRERSVEFYHGGSAVDGMDREIGTAGWRPAPRGNNAAAPVAPWSPAVGSTHSDTSTASAVALSSGLRSAAAADESTPAPSSFDSSFAALAGSRPAQGFGASGGFALGSGAHGFQTAGPASTSGRGAGGGHGTGGGGVGGGAPNANDEGSARPVFASSETETFSSSANSNSNPGSTSSTSTEFAKTADESGTPPRASVPPSEVADNASRVTGPSSPALPTSNSSGGAGSPAPVATAPASGNGSNPSTLPPAGPVLPSAGGDATFIAAAAAATPARNLNSIPATAPGGALTGWTPSVEAPRADLEPITVVPTFAASDNAGHQEPVTPPVLSFSVAPDEIPPSSPSAESNLGPISVAAIQDTPGVPDVSSSLLLALMAVGAMRLVRFRMVA